MISSSQSAAAHTDHSTVIPISIPQLNMHDHENSSDRKKICLRPRKQPFRSPSLPKSPSSKDGAQQCNYSTPRYESNEISLPALPELVFPDVAASEETSRKMVHVVSLKPRFQRRSLYCRQSHVSSSRITKADESLSSELAESRFFNPKTPNEVCLPALPALPALVCHDVAAEETK